MAFVKFDTAILHSSLWPQKTERDLFITALLMAEPYEILDPTPQLRVRELKETGWKVPPGWYGIIKGAGSGIIHQAMVDRDCGLAALEALGNPDLESRSQDFSGRRLVRIDGGYIVLNYMKYRERDYTAAERSKRWRERQKKIEAEAKLRAGGGTIRPEHRADKGKPKTSRRVGMHVRGPNENLQ